MKKNNKESNQVISILLYVIAFITAVYTLFTIYASHEYISNLISTQGLVVSEQLVNVISYYINASMPYIFYTIATWGIGYIIYKLDNIKVYEGNKEDKVVRGFIDPKRAEQDLDSFANTLKVNKNNIE
ncbi:hypothetical protein [Clostridium sp. LP20]|uniref:hypothetical protein n=1 Tax=Clostridium sp. LP20 TaxID=3418665 RepID=UPI003EE72D01